MKANRAFCLLSLMILPVLAAGCTAALVQAGGSGDGVPLLWKNRDTDSLFNRVVFVRETPCSYLALVDNEDKSGRRCFAGLNDQGFAVINTVAYNLESKSGEEADLEGIIMADALRTCRTTADFEDYLKSNLGKNLGSLANFGVMDATGSVVLFEVSNHSYEKLDLVKLKLPYLVVTNFSRSGARDKGAGYLRFERASALFRERFPNGAVGFGDLLKYIARDTSDPLLESPSYHESAKLSHSRPLWVSTRNTINRAFTSCTILVKGKKPSKKDSTAVFWIIPGEPLTAPALPFFVEACDTPPEVREGREAPLWKESMRIKHLVRKTVPAELEDYLNLSRVNNIEARGYIKLILDLEESFIIRTERFLETSHSPAEFREFQNGLAREALEIMKKIG